MKNLTTILLSSLFLTVTIFFSCKTDKTKNNKVDDIEISENENKLVYPIPTPFEITQTLHNSGASYIFDLTNPTENSTKYFTEKSKALNLGVYGADLSYSSTYNKSQDTRSILAIAKKLTEDLGLSSLFDEEFIQKVDKNIENEDSIYKIVSDSYYDTFNQLSNNQKGNIAVMVLTGGWIESLYLMSQLTLSSSNNTELLKGIAQQRMTSSTLMPLLQTYKDNADVAELIKDVEKIKAVFDKLQEVNDEFVMTEEQFKELVKVVEEIRTKIIMLS